MLRLKAGRKIGPRAVRKTKNQFILIKNYVSANVTVRFFFPLSGQLQTLGLSDAWEN